MSWAFRGIIVAPILAPVHILLPKNVFRLAGKRSA